MTEEQIESVVERGIVKAFRDLGISAGEDDASAVFEFRRDLAFLREWRQTCEQVRSKGTLAVVSMVVAAMSALLVMGARGFFH